MSYPTPVTRRAWAHPSSPAVVAVLALSLLAYLLTTPPTLDLAAQVARAAVFREHGVHIWWSGWFGGTDLLGYSVLAPVLMAALGVPVAGSLATLAATVSGTPLFQTARRPRLALAAFVVLLLADLFAGRVTFVIGSAFAVMALAAVHGRGRRGAAFAVTAGVATTLGSPLAGLFLGLLLLAVAITDRSRRRVAVLSAVAAAVPVVVTTALFPSAAVMPFSRSGLAMTLTVCVILLAAVPNRLVRCAVVLLALAVVGSYVVPSAIGSNVSRLAMLFAAPVLIGWGTGSRRVLALALVPLVAWPALDLAGQLSRASDPSSQQRYYTPLLAELDRLQQNAQAAGQPGRVEIVDPRTHWASVYIAERVPLARGWERQLDVADNALFYTGPLTAASYHDWLHQLAVRWVAAPDAPLDYAAQAEGALVRRGLPYLVPVWAGPHWRLYAVRDPEPLVTGPATVVALTATGVDLEARAAGVVWVALRYSPYLRARGLDSAAAGLTGCVQPAGAWTSVRLPAAGTYRLDAAWSIAGVTRLEGGSC